MPQLLAFVNDLCQDIEKARGRQDAFQYEEEDRFPLDDEVRGDGDPPVAIVLGDTPEACADTTAAEIARLLAEGALIRDRTSGVPRPVRPGDVAILFRTRESPAIEEALEIRRAVIRLQGLGFFDATRSRTPVAPLVSRRSAVKMRAAAWLRSRFVRI